ncbi:hypothetical protein EVAR_92800_1 [Eumeta japonica]|uniref:Uncharacterized protein n=1 Tax=Eumeta variegata TaxID=151549 RepID=A0A4C2A3W8_EUMVA|nr:hypothetical protein EVAR_92800_1 [Eumeta japonica]
MSHRITTRHRNVPRFRRSCDRSQLISKKTNKEETGTQKILDTSIYFVRFRRSFRASWHVAMSRRSLSTRRRIVFTCSSRKLVMRVCVKRWCDERYECRQNIVLGFNQRKLATI